MSASTEPEKDAAAAAATEGDEKTEAKDSGSGWELLYCGGTSFDAMGRKVVGGAQGNLVSPTRLRPLVGVDIRFVASGCTACHCVALDAGGKCYTWGRNEKGQLGHGDTLLRNLPTVVSQLSKYKIIKACVGRNHTVVVTDDGKSLSFGHNKHGQLGTGSLRNEIESSPVSCIVAEATNVACGADFTAWLSSVEGSSILTAGLPQYGQLGHGTDNEYNAKESSVKLTYEPQPRPRAIAAFSGKTVVKVACGTNHTVAVDSNGFVYTTCVFRLNVFYFLLLMFYFLTAGASVDMEEITSGTFSILGYLMNLDAAAIALDITLLHLRQSMEAFFVHTTCGGQLYMWGKMKNTGDDWMYPKPVMDLSGWNIRCMASGNMHHIVGADDSCISWGVAQNGELGYGPNGQKSSANPKKVDILEGMHVTSVGCGFGLSLIVVDRANVGDRLGQLEIYDGDTGAEVEKVEVQVTKKASASTNSRANKRKKTKDVSESESEEDDDDDEDESGDDENGGVEESKGRRGRKPANRGRGRGGKKATPEAKPSGRGRGRPKKTESSAQKAGGTSGRGKRGRPRK
ncbi:Protein RCC2 [Zea mays]|uniref:Protein RCC2 n=1 Tax=Zea mays TaxID=4577 RepID=A0A1D6JH25_MAIZE|nr:Protein RCC2 [Zea mays]